ncbi:hypothetical protein, partial [Cryptosporangium minutisporangium]|uniref:hypothetical protein n=1 Tax=Cryptosporangium minutisporangium TaxID=113569 RepID=UPI0035EDC276
IACLEFDSTGGFLRFPQVEHVNFSMIGFYFDAYFSASVIDEVRSNTLTDVVFEVFAGVESGFLELAEAV